MAEVRAPEVCKTCDGEGFLVATFGGDGGEGAYEWPCPSCSCCPICGNESPNGIECDDCFDEAEAHFARAVDRG